MTRSEAVRKHKDMSILKITITDKRTGVLNGEDVIDTSQTLTREYKLFGVVLFRRKLDFEIELNEKGRKPPGFSK